MTNPPHTCPPFCVHHEDFNADDAGPELWAHQGQESTIEFRQHGHTAMVLKCYDDPGASREYKLFLYPSDGSGLEEWTLEEARQFNAELSIRIAQADADQKGVPPT
ncbi:hypothetical protein [Nocardia wallacei]|uniref:hypothetical protein n=1 Tax=Nocardia wallacei TaxID=480035 RepID=UPI0024550E60|nr:hypothetical protein [Nocardia wallacei]